MLGFIFVQLNINILKMTDFMDVYGLNEWGKSRHIHRDASIGENGKWGGTKPIYTTSDRISCLSKHHRHKRNGCAMMDIKNNSC
jgi:hypothetical protein